MAAERPSNGRASRSEGPGDGGLPREIPDAPGDLGAHGLAAWESVWSEPQILESDRLSVERLCRPHAGTDSDLLTGRCVPAASRLRRAPHVVLEYAGPGDPAGL